MDQAWTFVAALAALTGTWTGCGGAASDAGSGSTCFHVDDCREGLVCIDQKCTNDLTSIDIHPEGGGAGARATDGSVPPDESSAPVLEASSAGGGGGSGDEPVGVSGGGGSSAGGNPAPEAGSPDDAALAE